MAAAARAFVVSRVNDRYLNSCFPPHLPTPSFPSSRYHHNFAIQRRRHAMSSGAIVCCLVSGVDGGGVSDDFVSTEKSGFDRGFSVIANMLKRIQPFDTSVISKGVSDSARDSMKQTISSMLGLLPSDQFAVTIRVSKGPLNHLLVSSIITGYTLWNAEYRMSLIRNFDISPIRSNNSLLSKHLEVSEFEGSGKASELGVDLKFEDSDATKSQLFDDLPPKALNCIQKLQSQLSNVNEELSSQKKEKMELEYDRENRNNLLVYLRSLDSDMVTELSRPSSLEVEEIIHQLVPNISQKVFKDDINSNFLENSGARKSENCLNDDNELRDSISTSRDHLAKLLFWCMLMGHHLRGLENRLHLSCVVGLL